MRYGIILTLIWLAVVAAVFALTRKHPIFRKRWFRAGTVVGAAVLVTVIGLIPMIHRTQVFSSPEEAFRWKNQGEIILTLEGEDSAFVAARDGASGYQVDCVARNGDGWSPSGGLSVERTVNASETAMVMIYHLKDSRDYYISVTVNSGDAVVADNCSSIFYPAAQETVETENGTVGLYHWYAWVCDMDDSYRLMVDGTDVI